MHDIVQAGYHESLSQPLFAHPKQLWIQWIPSGGVIDQHLMPPWTYLLNWGQLSKSLHACESAMKVIMCLVLKPELKTSTF